MKNMKNLRHALPVLFAFMALLALSACNTASNMAHEVPSWFNTNSSKGGQAAGPSGESAPAAAPPMEVTSAPLAPTGSDAPKKKVAILLPLTGDKASLGKAFLDAAQMAVMDVGGQNLELLPEDTGGEPAKAQAAAQAAVAAGAQMIIGPVFAAQVPAVKAGAPNIPILALSNDWNVAGGNVYLMGFNPQEQVERMAAYAQESGVHNIAVLAPASSYGAVVESTLRNSSVSVAAVEKYQKNRESINNAVAALAAKRDSFQGILIPDGGAALSGIADALVKNKLTAKDVPIFGTGLWDDQDVSSNVGLLGGFYPASDPKARNAFFARFQASQGYKPVRLATLAYDATALAAALAAHGSFDSGAIENANGFLGLDGVFRFNHNIAERGLAVMKVGRGRSVASPAPTRF